MKKLLFLLFSLFCLCSPSVFAETYVCSQELGKYGRAGEVETLVFKRVGKSFERSRISYQISHESKSTILLTNIISSLDPAITIWFINKDTKEYGGKFLDMGELRKDKFDPHTYGKCVVVK